MNENQKPHGKFAKLNGGKPAGPRTGLNLGCLQKFGNRNQPKYDKGGRG